MLKYLAESMKLSALSWRQTHKDSVGTRFRSNSPFSGGIVL
jgi:hypothetical protein